MNKKLILAIGCIIFIILTICILVSAGIGILVLKNDGISIFSSSSSSSSDKTSASSETSTSKTTTTTTTTTSELTGKISGNIGYPSEFLPSQVVCAQEVESWEVFCTEEILGNSYEDFAGTSYTLELPVGKYYVYAYISDSEDEAYLEVAYYTKFVKCGMTVECPSHEYEVVEVKAGKTLYNIDPVDWYTF